jgi:hypothetical protein
MANQTTFTQEELAEIRLLQNKFQEKVFDFGKFRLERMQLLKLVKELEDRETKAEEEYNNLQGMEASLLDKLTKKYGEGSLDLSNGEFIPRTPISGSNG